MATGVIAAYREDFMSAAGHPTFKSQASSGLVFGKYTPWFDLTPVNKKFVLAAKVTFNYNLAGSPAAQSGADVLDVILGQIQVAPAQSSLARSQSITRKFVEDVEQVAYDTNYGYPRATPPVATGTYTYSFYVPVGGPAGALRILLASATNAYSAGTVTLNWIQVSIVEGDNSTVVIFNEQNTPDLGSGFQDMRPYLRSDITPDIIIMEGDTSSSVSQLSVINQAGKVLVDTTTMNDVTDGVLALTPRTGAIGSGSLAFMADQTLPRTFKVSFASSGTHEVGEIQFSGSETSAQAPTPATTPEPPAGQNVGVPNAANVPVRRPGLGLRLGK